MKRMHRVFVLGVIFSIVALGFSFFSMSDQAEAKTKVVTTKNGTKLYCSGISNGEYRIYNIENAKKELIIPETVDGKHKITMFDSEDIRECKEVERIYFPSGMKYLCEEADSVVDHGYRYNTFICFPNLKNVSFGKNNRYYSSKNGAVYDKKKRLVAILPGISKVKIDSWVTKVIPNAYENLTNLEQISVDKGNKKYKGIKGALYSKDGKKLIYYPIAKKDTVFRVPGGVEKIGNLACFGQKYVKELIMGSSVYKIGEDAFAYCDSLKKVSLNKKLKILKERAFDNKQWLTLSLPAGIEEVEIGSLPVKELEIPAGVKRVNLSREIEEREEKIRAKKLIVRSLSSLDLLEADPYCYYGMYDDEEDDEGDDAESVYKGKTIYAYKESKIYMQLKEVAEEYGIKLKVLKK